MPKKTKKTPSSPTNSGSTSTSDPKDISADFIDAAGVPQYAKHRGPGKNGASLQKRNEAETDRSARLAMVGELAVNGDPVTAAEDHVRTLAPGAVKELEYLAKFGSDQMRYLVNKDLLAIAGLSTKPKDSYMPPVSMTFNVGELPTTAKGVPILPFSNAGRKQLDAPKTPVTIDVTKKE